MSSSFDLVLSASAGGVWRGDSTRVRQILYNLVSNALKFTEEGEVKVDLDRTAQGLELRVRDTGIGMSKTEAAKLFQKFEQADASTTRRFGGTGLGLSICRELATLMGGGIKVTSSPGKGSTFTATLPLERVRDAEARTETDAAASPDPTTCGPLKVLAAEDNRVNQLVLKTLLHQIGLDPVVVDNGRAALAAWEDEPWDVILMDVQMPEMDGPTATARIREREAATGRSRTPIIALTANAMAHQVAEYRAAGMDDFVAKPIEIAKLFAALQAVLPADDAEAA